MCGLSKLAREERRLKGHEERQRKQKGVNEKKEKNIKKTRREESREAIAVSRLVGCSCSVAEDFEKRGWPKGESIHRWLWPLGNDSVPGILNHVKW